MKTYYNFFKIKVGIVIVIISSSLLNYFQQVYIINLPERTDRRNEINEQLNLIGLSLEHEKINLFKATRPQDAGEFESIGARGCYLSHLNVLKHAKSKAYDRILIIEDDLNFSHDFSNKIDETIKELSQNNWQIFYGSHVLEQPISVGDSQLTHEILPSTVLMTASFIGFQGAIINEMIDHLGLLLSRKNGDSRGGPMHVDGAYLWFRSAHPSYKTRISMPQLGHQRSSRSDIYTLRWFDKALVVRECVAFLRMLKNKLN